MFLAFVVCLKMKNKHIYVCIVAVTFTVFLKHGSQKVLLHVVTCASRRSVGSDCRVRHGNVAPASVNTSH